MKTILVGIVCSSVLFGTLAQATAAFAQEKAKKPVICSDFTPLEGQKLGICKDGKKPFLLRSFKVVQFETEEGQAASYVLGWR